MSTSILDHGDSAVRRGLIVLHVAAADDALSALGRRLYGPAWVCVSRAGSVANDTAAAIELLKSLLHWCDARGVLVGTVLNQASLMFLEEQIRPQAPVEGAAALPACAGDETHAAVVPRHADSDSRFTIASR